LTITGDMDADSYIMENDAQLDNAANGTVTLTEAGSVLSAAFDGTDVSLDVDTGGLTLTLTSAANGSFDIKTNNVTTDFMTFTQGTNQSTMTATGTGNDLYLVAAGGDINLADETITGTGDLSIGGITCTSITGIDTITGSTNSDVLSFATDDTLAFSSDNGDSATVIQIVGYSGKDARLKLSADAAEDAGDEWFIDVDETDNLLGFWNETTELIDFDTSGNIDMVTGTTLTMGNDEAISNATDNTLIAYSASAMVLDVRSTGTSGTSAAVNIQADNATDVLDGWQLLANDSATGTLVIGCDAATSETYVAKMTIAGADGDITTTGDVEIVDDMDLVFGTSSDVKIQWDDAVDDQFLFLTAATTCTATTDPIYEFLVGAVPTADQEVFGIAKGTQASNTELFRVDEDGDIFVAGTSALVGDVTITGDAAVNGNDLTLGATGVKFTSDADGAVTLLGLSAGYDEDLTINLDDAENEVTLSSSTGVTLVDLDGNLDLEISGNDLTIGETGVKITSDGDGALTFLGLSAGSDEDLTINLDDTSNEVSLSSSTGVTLIDIEGAIDLQVAGGDFTMPSSTASKPVIWLENTADDATAPSIILENDRATEADGDDCGTIFFRASDSGDATFDAVTILGEATDITATTEAGSLTIDVEVNDVATEMLHMFGDAGAVATAHFEINADTADVDVHIDTNDQADFLLIDATTNDLTLTRALAAGATTDGAILVVSNTSATGDVGVASFLNAAAASATEPTVTIQSSATGVVKSSLLVNHDGTAGATTEAAVVIDTDDVNTSALYIMSPVTAAGTTSQIDDYALAVVAEGIGGGASIYRNVTGATEALLNVREVHADSTAPLVNINTAADATADDSVVTIQASAATLDTTLLDVINAGVGRSIFVDQNVTTGVTLVPAMEIDSQATNGAALIVRAPTTLTGTDANFDDFVMAVSAEGVGGGLHVNRSVDDPTGPLVRICDDLAAITTSNDNTLEVVCDGDASVSAAVVAFTTTDAGHDQPVLSVTQAGTGEAINIVSGALAVNGDSITCDGVLIIDATSATSFNDENITNVGSIALDSLTSDADTVISLNDGVVLLVEDLTTTAADPGLATATAVTVISTIVTDDTGASADEVSLTNGTKGQIKIFTLKTDTETSGVKVIPANFANGTSILFEDAGDGCIMVFDGTNWVLVSNVGGTVA